MAKLYTDASGALLRCDVTPGQLQQSAPANTANTLDFDPTPNAVLVTNIQLQPLAVRYDGQSVTIAGHAYAVQAPGDGYSDQVAMLAAARAFLSGTDLTLVQLNKLCRWLLRQALAG